MTVIMTGITISTSIASEVTLGTGIYLSPLTLTASGRIDTTAQSATAVYAGLNAIGSSVLNHGEISGAISATTSGNVAAVLSVGSINLTNYGTISGQSAVYLESGGTVVNSGTIAGLDTKTKGEFGVRLVAAELINSGTIIGQAYGEISSGGYVSNTGHITGGTVGVLLLNPQNEEAYETRFLNAGTVQGADLGVQTNFGDFINARTGVIIGGTSGGSVGAYGYFLNAGKVSAASIGLVVESYGDAINAGTVVGNQVGVQLYSSGVMTNVSAGFVYSQHTAALDQGAYLVNYGTFLGETYAVRIISGGVVNNFGTVFSAGEGIYLSNSSVTSTPDYLFNGADIYGQKVGVNIQNGTAYNYGTIRALQTAVNVVSGTSLINSAYVYGATCGVQLLGGTVTNRGLIGGKIDGIKLTHGYIINSGTITGTKYAVYGESFSLTIDPGAVFNGRVVDKTDSSTLDLAAGSTLATLTGIGTSYAGFSKINFASNANWLVSGSISALDNNRTINGFHLGDTIVLNGISTTSDSFVSGQGLELFLPTQSYTLDILGTFTTANFGVTSSPNETTIALEANAPCFMAGTRILTIDGEIAVEKLRVNDVVITQKGEDRAIIWIGRRTIDVWTHPRPNEVRPICISANAFAENVPHRDLWLSPDHALLIDNHLIPAKLLVNGMNIFQGERRKVTYYHVELAQHAVIFAENTAAETYLDTGNRHAFENANGSVMLLHPDICATLRNKLSCAPLLLSGDGLDEIIHRCSRRVSQKKLIQSFQL